MPGTGEAKSGSRSHSDSESDSSSIFDSAPSSPVSLKALKEDLKLEKPTEKSALAKQKPRTLTAQNVTPPLPMTQLFEQSKLGSQRSKTERTKTEKKQYFLPEKNRYSTMLADLRIPPVRRSSSLATAREGALSPRRVISDSPARVPRTANWQIPPHLHAQRRLNLLSKAQLRNGNGKARENVDPANVLKLKISCRESFDEIVALKLRKDRLRCLAELVEVVLLKLAGKLPCNRDNVKISLVFPNSALEPVTLKCPGGQDKLYNNEREDFMMGYVQAKSKIYVQVSS